MRSAEELVALDVHPSVVFKLGEDLISDELQALIELAKNSYDADASFARITVDTTARTPALTFRRAEGSSHDPSGANDNLPITSGAVASSTEVPTESAEEARPEVLIADVESNEYLTGLLTIEDNGVGMTPEIIKSGWLVISNSYKRAMKRAGRKTAKKRTPLGDKGLGRLGAQRLGRELEIITRPKGSSYQYRIRIPWRVFDAASRLGQVSFPLIREMPTIKQGTKLTIFGLSDLALWHERRDELTRELSTFVSPFPNRTDLALTVRVDGTDLELAQLTDQMRESAEIRYTLHYSSYHLSVLGRANIDYWKPEPGRPYEEHMDFNRLVERDNGKEFFEWFTRKNSRWADLWGLQRVEKGGRTFFDYSMRVDLDDIDGIAFIKKRPTPSSPSAVDESAADLDPSTWQAGESADLDLSTEDTDELVPADPGPFTAEIDSFSLDRGTRSIFDSSATYRSYFNAIAGIRIYRNGFGIRMPSDWLGLGKRWTGGTSYYNLKPSNVLGFVDLTAEHNSQLEEMTDREGFRASPYLTNFMLLMEEWRAFTEAVQSRLRREYNNYRREMTDHEGGVEPETVPTPEAYIQVLRGRADKRRKASQHQNQAIKGADAALANLEKNARELTTADLAATDTQQRLAEVEAGIQQVRSVVGQLAQARELQDVSDAQETELLSALRQQLELVREQLAMSYEAVALGLTAEALSHEVHQIADRLSSRTTQVRRALKANGDLNPALANYLEYVRSQASSLNRQMARLNPALRFARESKSTLSVLDFLHDLADYFNQRWQAKDQRRLVAIIDPASRDFTVTMNAGRLTQVMDNLLLNSEYWLCAQARREPPRTGRRLNPAADELPLAMEDDGKILLFCAPRYITVTDNGPGVDPSVEGTLLEPFVTRKREGRGLGLYISQQLLEAEGGRLRLDDARNMHRRRSSFTIDLEGVAAGT